MTRVTCAAGVTDATDATDVGETPFPLDLWSEAVYSRRSIPDTLATGEYAPDEPSTDSSSGTPPAGPRFALAPPPLRLEPDARASRGLADPSVLAALLHYSFGLFQHDLTPGGWPLHRAVASARCLYPSELYLLSPDADGRPADVYRFDPLRHQLALVRAAVDGRYPDPSTETGAPRFLVITSRFARTARLYGGYAPRLCAQEAGMLLGAVHLVAAALGLRTRTGLDRETLLELSDGWPESGAEHPMAYLEVSPAAEHHSWVPADTAGALRARHSGAALFDPEPAAAPKAMLDELCTVLAHAPFADFSCHLYLSRVTDLPSGRYLLAGGRLRLVQAGDVVPELEQIGQTEGRLSMNFRAVSFTAYLAVSRGAAVATYGADAFRRLHLVAGAAAHLLSVVAARHGQSARVHNGYEAATAERLLGLTGSGETVLFQIAVGAAKPGPGFRLPVIF